MIVLIGLSALMGSQGTTTKPLDSRTIWSGVVLWMVLVIIIKVTLRSKKRRADSGARFELD